MINRDVKDDFERMERFNKIVFRIFPWVFGLLFVGSIVGGIVEIAVVSHFIKKFW